MLPICINDEAGEPLSRGEVENEPPKVAQALAHRAPNLIRTVLETGPCGVYLYRGLKEQSASNTGTFV